MALQFPPEIAREVIEALLRVETAEAGRRLIYTLSTQSDAPSVGAREHRGWLRDHGDESVTIGTANGDVEIGWYEITSISVAPD